MTDFAVDGQLDTHKNFKFRVKWNGKYLAGVSKVSRLKRTTDVIAHRDGSDPSTSRKLPGRTEYDAITLERGVTHDQEFEKWAGQVLSIGSGPEAESSLAALRKDLVIEVYNEVGLMILSYKVFRCWVSEFVALPDLDANTNTILIQQFRLENEGWERDYSVSPP